jgi:hypothetical protein
MHSARLSLVTYFFCALCICTAQGETILKRPEVAVRREVKVVAGQIVTEAHALVTATVYRGRALRVQREQVPARSFGR